MPPEKIDAVYTWCDASDPIFAKQRRDLMILKGIPEVEELNGMVRFENHDELRYSLRSVFENLPWINHIYLITNKQRPTWLKEHPKITVVDHTEIIPSELLPTFSSVVIENYLRKLFKNPCSQAELNKIVPFGFSLQRQKNGVFCHQNSIILLRWRLRSCSAMEELFNGQLSFADIDAEKFLQVRRGSC